ncbi:MAG: recombinase family protein [Clostridia bacterium]|nr:recombinase family protein [Clostridia bacterium]
MSELITAVYLRKSRADEEAVTVADTLRRHKEILLEFASHQPNMQIYNIFEDVVSGDSLYARPQMLKLLEEAEQEKFNSVLCMDIDRLGRGATSEQGIILETFKNHGIRIITPRKVYDLNNDLDEEYAEFESFMARRELKTIKRRLHNGTLKSISEGCYLANAPYGYKNVRINKKSTLEINEDEAKFVRMTFDLYVNSGLGTQAIAHTINGLGAKPHRSEQFNRTSIAAMLRNKVYIGKVVWNKKHTLNRGAVDKKMKTIYHDKSDWLIYDGLHPAIVDEELFNKANEILASKYHKPYNDGTIQNPLCGILQCKKCGFGMQRRPYGSRKYQSTHLLCATKDCCTSSRLDYVEQAVIDNIKAKLDELKAAKFNTKTAPDYSAVLSGIDKELKNLQKQKNSLHDFLERGIYDVDTYVERSNVIAERTKDLNTRRESLLSKQTLKTKENADRVIKRMENVLKLYWSSTPPQRNKLLKEVVTGGTYYKERGWKPNQFSISLDYIDI